MQLHVGPRAIQVVETSPRVAEPYALADLATAGDAGSLVLQGQAQDAPVLARAQDDVRTPAVRLAMLDRVLHQWLEQEDWNARIEHRP
jgi:hypothetical protein